MSGEIAFANTALESFAALVTFVLLFACIAKIKNATMESNMLHRRKQRGIH